MESNTDLFKLSPHQKELWDDAVQQAARPVWQLALSIDGLLDLTRLRSAVERVITENEILRVRFIRKEFSATPLQRIERDVPSCLEVVDCTEIPDDEQQAMMRSLWANAAAGVVDFESEPVISFTLVRLNPSFLFLYVAVSKLCCDLPGLTKVLGQLVFVYGTG